MPVVLPLTQISASLTSKQSRHLPNGGCPMADLDHDSRLGRMSVLATTAAMSLSAGTGTFLNLSCSLKDHVKID